MGMLPKNEIGRVEIVTKTCDRTAEKDRIRREKRPVYEVMIH